MKITRAVAELLIDHINSLSRKEQIENLRSVLRHFETSPEKKAVQSALRKRKNDASDMAESYRAMP